MKNLKEATQKIKKAEKIVLYTDADLDGVTSALIMKKTLKEVGFDASCYFTNKEKRGYGLSSGSVDIFKAEAPALLVVMDCGISNFEGIKKAKKTGFDVLVLDHHKPHERTPEADLIVCPKMTRGGFKEYPNAGIILKLSELLLNQRRKDFVEYTALAIFADMMPHKNENAKVLREAEKNFPSTIGMDVLSEQLNIDDPLQLFQKASSYLNITSMVSGTPESFLYFLKDDRKEAERMIKKFVREYEERNKRVEEIKKRAEANYKGSPIIFHGSPDYESFLLGKVASRLVRDLNKPVFIYKIKGEESQGTVRVPSGYDAVKAMSASEEILSNYGGHPPAAGFTIKTEKLDQFKKNLTDYFRKI